jgi:hypothetical protein
MEPGDLFLIDHVAPDVDALSNLAVELRACCKKLFVHTSHTGAAPHQDLAARVLDYRVGRIAVEEAVEVTRVVGIDLSSHDGDRIGVHVITAPAQNSGNLTAGSV